MRTTINIPDDVMAELLNFAGASSKTEAVSIAIKNYVNLKRIQKLKSLRGKLEIDLNINELRDEEIKELGNAK